MTGSELKTFTESVMDNSVTLDDDFFYQLLNIAKTKLEAKRLWQYLKKLDDSNSVTTGSVITLPTDFALDYKVTVGTDKEYLPVPFEEQHLYANSAYRYFIDHAAGTLKLLGTVAAGILYLFYKRFTPDITASTSPVFPARFHPLLGFYVAGYYQNGVDSDDVFARMSPENKLAALELERAMNAWDTSLALRAQNHQVGVAESSPSLNLSDL